MQAVAAELSGYAGKPRCFLEKSFEKFVLIHFILEQALKRTRCVRLRAF